MIEYKIPKFPGMTYLTKGILDNFCRYFQCVVDEFFRKIDSSQDIGKFRDAVGQLMKISSDETLRERFLLDGVEALEVIEAIDRQKEEDARV